MLRKRQPWIQRKSRFLIGSIATIGIVDTAYLTISRLLNAAVVCPVEGCDKVLESPYATLFGVVPLSAIGFVAYLTMAILAIGPWLINPETQKQRRSQLEDLSWTGLLLGSSSMVVFSGYLMSVMTFEIRAICVYCILSALCTLSMFLITITGRAWEDVGQVAFTSVIVAMITLVGTLALYAPLNATADSDATNGYPITTTSQPDNIALAEHLTASGSKMYGAFWCSHCHDQKQLLGKEAVAKIDYVECDPKGKNPQVEVCEEKKIQSYPTWEIEGEIHLGVQPLPELARLSGYQGSSNFGVK